MCTREFPAALCVCPPEGRSSTHAASLKALQACRSAAERPAPSGFRPFPTHPGPACRPCLPQCHRRRYRRPHFRHRRRWHGLKCHALQPVCCRASLRVHISYGSRPRVLPLGTQPDPYLPPAPCQPHPHPAPGPPRSCWLLLHPAQQRLLPAALWVPIKGRVSLWTARDQRMRGAMALDCSHPPPVLTPAVPPPRSLPSL